jgi:hypothetical protein
MLCPTRGTVWKWLVGVHAEREESEQQTTPLRPEPYNLRPRRPIDYFPKKGSTSSLQSAGGTSPR